MAKEKVDVYQARVSFVANGRVIKVGETVRAGHQLVVQYPDKFEPFKVTYDVEQATAAPGEKRTTSAKKG